MTQRRNMFDLDHKGIVGDWCFLAQDTKIAVRYGGDAFKQTVIIPISDTGSDIPPVWKWDGNKEAPTITPSILVNSVPGWNPGWHGFLTAGKLITV